jgi:hypothetical protein
MVLAWAAILFTFHGKGADYIRIADLFFIVKI